MNITMMEPTHFEIPDAHVLLFQRTGQGRR